MNDAAQTSAELAAEIQRLRQQLTDSESRFQTILESLPFDVFILDETGQYAMQNSTSRSYWGNIVGQRPAEVAKDAETLALWQSNNARAFGGDVVKGEVQFPVHGEPRYFENIIAPILEDGSIRGILGVNIDITERKRLENELRAWEEIYRTIFDHLPDPIGVIALSEPPHFLDSNRANCDMLGYSRAELLDKGPRELDTPETAARTPDIIAHLKRDGHYVFEIEHTRRDGTPIPSEVNATVIKYRGQPAILSVSRNLTERKRAEAQLKAALHEKEALMKEMLHRTKNNMGSIGMLIQLQIKHTSDPAMRHILQDLENRVRSMALVQQKLYRSHDISRLDLKDYLHELACAVFHNLRVYARQIELTFDLEPVIVSSDIAIPCGLVVNELLTNALKYAFPGDRRGTIHLALRRLDADLIEIRVCDTGVGFPQEMDFRKTDSLGLELVNLFTEHQLKGHIELHRAQGATFIIRFPNW